MTPEDLRQDLTTALTAAGWGRAVERGDELDALVARTSRYLDRPPGSGSGADRDVQEAMRRVADAVVGLAEVVLDEAEELARTLASRLDGAPPPRLAICIARVLLPSVVRAAVAASMTGAGGELHVVGRTMAATSTGPRPGAARP